jgi:hypothetical protein
MQKKYSNVAFIIFLNTIDSLVYKAINANSFYSKRNGQYKIIYLVSVHFNFIIYEYTFHFYWQNRELYTYKLYSVINENLT